MPGCECTLEYFKSLVDPFEVGGVKLGWGCMVPSTAGQAYFRGQTNTFTDGSLLIAAVPCATTGILIWNSGLAAIGSNSAINYSNAPAIIANCGEGRCVSIGIRAFPNVALTSVPGVAYSGATVAVDANQIATLSITDFVALPTSHQSIGTNGISSTGRPIDPESFIFTQTTVDNLGYLGLGNTFKSIPFSVPYVVFTGLPSTTAVFFEVVMNFEATQAVAHLAQTMLPDTDGVPQGDTVGDYWPTPEALHRPMSRFLPHPGRPGEATASKDVGYLQALWSGLKGVGSAVANLGVDTVGGRVAGGLINAAASTVSQKLLGSGSLSGQRYGSRMGGYLQ